MYAFLVLDYRHKMFNRLRCLPPYFPWTEIQNQPFLKLPCCVFCYSTENSNTVTYLAEGSHGLSDPGVLLPLLVTPCQPLPLQYLMKSLWLRQELSPGVNCTLCFFWEILPK